MDVHTCIRTRREVREFLDRPIPGESLRKVLEAGRLAPSRRNRQPWHFIAVQDRETLKRLGALAESGPYIADAPCAVAVVLAGARMPQVDGTRAV
ncbi:MAG: nitroreductase family protein, partial [Nitrospinota bacterium]